MYVSSSSRRGDDGEGCDFLMYPWMEAAQCALGASQAEGMLSGWTDAEPEHWNVSEEKLLGSPLAKQDQDLHDLVYFLSCGLHGKK